MVKDYKISEPFFEYGPKCYMYGKTLLKMAKGLDKLEIRALLSGNHDQNNAIITIHPGAGGTESQDWAQMLYRMYSMWCDKNGFKLEELDYLDALEQLFSDYVDPNNLSKNRLKAIYEAMFSHYKNVSKFARTTQAYATAETKAYRKLLEKSYSSYSDFVFKKLKTIGGSYEATLAAIKTIKIELESAINELCVDLAHSICTLFNYETNTSLAQLLSKKYRNEWVAKRQKSFDYCTNAFLEFTSTVGESELDCNVIVSLSKSLTGFELMYWSDSHKAEFLDKLKDIKDKLDAYEVKSSLGESETRMTLKTSDGQEKSVVFDRSDLSPLSQTIKNKINATFNNYGMSVTYDDKVQVLLSLIEDLMEGN